MLRPDEIDKIVLMFNRHYDISSATKLIGADEIEDVIAAINLAGYKLVKEDD